MELTTSLKRPTASVHTKVTGALRRFVVGAAAGTLLALFGGIGLSGPANAAGDPPPPPSLATLYVSPAGSSSNTGTSCSDASYTSIQAAVDAASPGGTVFVCAGNYDEQVSISTANLTLTGAGASSVIDPTTSTGTVKDLDSGATLVAIVDVAPGTTGVTVSDLELDGSGLSSSSAVSGHACGNPDFAGVVFQAASGTADSLDVANVELPHGLFYCASNPVIGIFAQSGPSGHANVTISQNEVTSYKNAIVCEDSGTNCNINNNTVDGTVGPSLYPGYAGVDVYDGAAANVSHNQISNNDNKDGTNPYEPQADYGYGIEVYDAARNTLVQGNTFTNDQIGVMLVHSDANVTDNTISETSPGIDGSVGVFALGCDVYCGFFNLSGGSANDAISNNTISFPGTLATPLSGSTGVWAGDGAVASAPHAHGYSNNPGTVQVQVNGDTITGAVNNVVLGPAATGQVNIPPAAPAPTGTGS